MKALVLEEQNTPFVMKEVPDPVAGPAEAVARVLACGAGLTIQHYKIGRAKIDTPRIIGHEITGEIVEVGAGATNVKIGDPVTAYYYLNCGHCPRCLANMEPLCENLAGNVGKDCDGGYAEFIKLPAENFMVLPDGLDYKNHPAEVGVAVMSLQHVHAHHALAGAVGRQRVEITRATEGTVAILDPLALQTPIGHCFTSLT